MTAKVILNADLIKTIICQTIHLGQLKKLKLKKEPIILNIESATDKCSVSISRGETFISFQEAEKSFEHAKVLTSLIDKCLVTAGLNLKEMDAVAVSSGPGSYTSLRVGISTAKGICYALDKPLISVDTLQALAFSGREAIKLENTYCCPMIDARRMEVYFSLFDENNKLLAGPTAMVVEEGAFDDYFNKNKKIIFCGNGAEKCKSILTSENAYFQPSECSALYLPAISNQLFKNGKFEDVAYFKPKYLKPPNITTPKNMNLLKA